MADQKSPPTFRAIGLELPANSSRLTDQKNSFSVGRVKIYNNISSQVTVNTVTRNAQSIQRFFGNIVNEAKI